jgi:hypothetical protein
LSIDNHCRHRGSDENDSPLLRDGEVVPGEGDVVIGGERSDQADGKAADCLVGTKASQLEGAEASLGKQLC